jgi:hypothetical protein
MHIALAPFKLKHGVAEETLLNTSEEFENLFYESRTESSAESWSATTTAVTPTLSSSRTRRRSSASWRQSDTATSARRSSRSWTTTAHTACSRS